jgi:hypothetical protein
LTVDELREELRAEAAQRDYGPAAAAELEWLLTTGTADEIARVLRDLPAPVRNSEIVVCPETTEAFLRVSAEHQERADAHMRCVVALGRKLGADVAAHRLTLEGAERRLDAVAFAFDESAPLAIGILPWHAARDVARAAFEEGLAHVAA